MKWNRETLFGWTKWIFEVIPSWVPFVSAMALCYLVSSNFGPGMRSWEPAFYSFLPMCFFFVGVDSHWRRRELRELREKVANLEASADPGGEGVQQNLFADGSTAAPASARRDDGAIAMRGLFSDRAPH